MKKSILIAILLGLIINAGFSQTKTNGNFKKHFDKYGVDGCFVLYNQYENTYVRYNSSLCDTGYIPASTFKIPHALIALEENVVKDTNEVIKWNGHNWPKQEWNKDQTLASSMKHSCIWVYFGFAETIGIDKYNDFVNAFDYGNKDLTGPPTHFWLEGLLKISANQQVEFLQKLYNNTLPASKSSQETVKDIIVLEQTNTYILSGKTGGGTLDDNKYIMWMVGYIVKDNKPYFYALNFESSDWGNTKDGRYGITKDILKDLQLID